MQLPMLHRSTQMAVLKKLIRRKVLELRWRRHRAQRRLVMMRRLRWELLQLLQRLIDTQEREAKQERRDQARRAVGNMLDMYKRWLGNWTRAIKFQSRLIREQKQEKRRLNRRLQLLRKRLRKHYRPKRLVDRCFGKLAKALKRWQREPDYHRYIENQEIIWAQEAKEVRRYLSDIRSKSPKRQNSHRQTQKSLHADLQNFSTFWKYEVLRMKRKPGKIQAPRKEPSSPEGESFTIPKPPFRLPRKGNSKPTSSRRIDLNLEDLDADQKFKRRRTFSRKSSGRDILATSLIEVQQLFKQLTDQSPYARRPKENLNLNKKEAKTDLKRRRISSGKSSGRDTLASSLIEVKQLFKQLTDHNPYDRSSKENLNLNRKEAKTDLNHELEKAKKRTPQYKRKRALRKENTSNLKTLLEMSSAMMSKIHESRVPSTYRRKIPIRHKYAGKPKSKFKGVKSKTSLSYTDSMRSAELWRTDDLLMRSTTSRTLKKIQQKKKRKSLDFETSDDGTDIMIKKLRRQGRRNEESQPDHTSDRSSVVSFSDSVKKLIMDNRPLPPLSRKSLRKSILNWGLDSRFADTKKKARPKIQSTYQKLKRMNKYYGDSVSDSYRPPRKSTRSRGTHRSKNRSRNIDSDGLGMRSPYKDSDESRNQSRDRDSDGLGKRSHRDSDESGKRTHRDSDESGNRSHRDSDEIGKRSHRGSDETRNQSPYRDSDESGKRTHRDSDELGKRPHRDSDESGKQSHRDSDETKNQSPYRDRDGLGKQSPYRDRDGLGNQSPYRESDGLGKRSPYRESDGLGKRSLYRESDGLGKRSPYKDSDGSGKRSPYKDSDESGNRSRFINRDRSGKRSRYGNIDGSDKRSHRNSDESGNRSRYKASDGSGKRSRFRNIDGSGKRSLTKSDGSRNRSRYKDSDGSSYPVGLKEVQQPGDEKENNTGYRTSDSIQFKRDYLIGNIDPVKFIEGDQTINQRKSKNYHELHNTVEFKTDNETKDQDVNKRSSYLYNQTKDQDVNKRSSYLAALKKYDRINESDINKTSQGQDEDSIRTSEREQARQLKNIDYKLLPHNIKIDNSRSGSITASRHDFGSSDKNYNKANAPSLSFRTKYNIIYLESDPKYKQIQYFLKDVIESNPILNHTRDPKELMKRVGNHYMWDKLQDLHDELLAGGIDKSHVKKLLTNKYLNYLTSIRKVQISFQKHVDTDPRDSGQSITQTSKSDQQKSWHRHRLSTRLFRFSVHGQPKAPQHQVPTMDGEINKKLVVQELKAERTKREHFEDSRQSGSSSSLNTMGEMGPDEEEDLRTIDERYSLTNLKRMMKEHKDRFEAIERERLMAKARQQQVDSKDMSESLFEEHPPKKPQLPKKRDKPIMRPIDQLYYSPRKTCREQKIIKFNSEYLEDEQEEALEEGNEEQDSCTEKCPRCGVKVEFPYSVPSPKASSAILSRGSIEACAKNELVVNTIEDVCTRCCFVHDQANPCSQPPEVQRKTLILRMIKAVQAVRSSGQPLKCSESCSCREIFKWQEKDLRS